ncbi:uncharacterized protein [Montipora foliosa]|uniref:uncharacterized protein n=1 Tax=Montipora foliosa TaxID=591990 RepID=UPI0035F1A888
MSFSFFRGEDALPRGQFRVPPSFLCSYAKIGSSQPDEESVENQHLNTRLDGTIQGRSLGINANLTPTLKPEDPRTSDELCANTKRDQFVMVSEEAVGIERAVDINRNHLVDLQRSIQTRLTGSTLETEDVYPFGSITCTGQRMDLTVSQKNQSKRCPGIPEEVSEPEVVGNGKTAGAVNCSNGVSLNKLYSCLKKMKCRRNDSGNYENLATISMNGREHGFSKTYFQRALANNVSSQPTHARRDQEEMFLLVGGKSKPVRFEIDPHGLNLLEKEWRVELRTRNSLSCNSSNEEGLKLFQKFRSRFRMPNHRPPLGRSTPNLLIPWARHVVHRGRSQSPEKRDKLEKDETGRKLSIHVYLPNAGWDEQRSPTPTTPVLSPSR